MTELLKYDTACRALAEARNADEVKHVRNAAMAMKLYARQAKNKALEADAFEIRLRAERRLGQMMEDGKGDRASVGGHKRFSKNPLPTLEDAKIDKNLANRARKLNALSEKEFSTLVAEGRDDVQRSVERSFLSKVNRAGTSTPAIRTAEMCNVGRTGGRGGLLVCR
jgi:hypothetical protein